MDPIPNVPFQALLFKPQQKGPFLPMHLQGSIIKLKLAKVTVEQAKPFSVSLQV